MSHIQISNYVACFHTSALAWAYDLSAWELTYHSNEHVRRLMQSLSQNEFIWQEEIAIHSSAIIENSATLKGPLIVGPGCFIAAGAYIRGGSWLEAHCIIGPGAELKSSFVFSGSKLAHFNFVGDSILGRNVNLEAGSIIANYRNEWDDKEIIISPQRIKTGVDKFGALVGDGCRIGANAVIAPGTLLPPNHIVPRLALLDQISESIVTA